MMAYSLIIFLPFLSAITSGFCGWYLGYRNLKYFTISYNILLFSLVWLVFYRLVTDGNFYYINFFRWIESNDFFIDWCFFFDSVTILMLVIVVSVSFLVHLYSLSYMENDPHLSKFLSYLSLFTFFMVLLVTGNNFLVLFLGWEGVGLCSFLLISFWSTRVQANKAALKAMIFNRIGDFFLILGIVLIYTLFKTLNFSTLFALVPYFTKINYNIFFFEFNLINLICFFLFLGCMGKSAQIGLHAWLPDAMEGPTPVSALIHAATMVTAGVYLLIRCSPLFEFAPNTLSFITIIGGLTGFFAATVALVQNDIKKIIAYSTCSQLGYMVFACGLSNYNVAFFHLFNHAFFKALLFLAAGSIIHALQDEQDIRKMGGLVNVLPLTYVSFLIASLSLAGFPFLSGFYSKELILEVAYVSYTSDSYFTYWLGTLTAFITACYSVRLLLYSFITKPNGNKVTYDLIHFESNIFVFVFVVLIFGSIFSGYVFKEMFIGVGSDFFTNSIYISPNNLNLIEAEFLASNIKLIPLIFSILGCLVPFLVLNAKFFFSEEFFYKIYSFLMKKWYFDYLYNFFIGLYSLSISYFKTFISMDKGFFELFGPSGLSSSIYMISRRIKVMHGGYLYNYNMQFLLILFFLIIYILQNLYLIF